MKKRIISMILVLSLSLTMASPAFAYEDKKTMSGMKTHSFEFNGETITYDYLEENGEVVYAEVGNDVIERAGDEIFVNGVKVATITITPLSDNNAFAMNENPVMPLSSWAWSESGNSSDFNSTAYDSYVRNIALEKALGVIAVGTLAALFVAFLPIEAVAKTIAQKVIEGATGIYATYQSSKSLYCLETVYKHKYLGISYAKKVNQKFYYDSELKNMVPGGEKTIYGFWS